MLASIHADGQESPSKATRKTSKRDNMTQVTAAFRAHVAGHASSWHPHGDKIPRFSPSHCSTGSVLLLQALLSCDHVSLYGYHACSCERACSAPHISARNHYWDKKETPQFGAMLSRYEQHMLLYQRLEHACGVSFRIARTGHCDSSDS